MFPYIGLFVVAKQLSTTTNNLRTCGKHRALPNGICCFPLKSLYSRKMEICIEKKIEREYNRYRIKTRPIEPIWKIIQYWKESPLPSAPSHPQTWGSATSSCGGSWWTPYGWVSLGPCTAWSSVCPYWGRSCNWGCWGGVHGGDRSVCYQAIIQQEGVLYSERYAGARLKAEFHQWAQQYQSHGMLTVLSTLLLITNAYFFAVLLV